MPNWHTPTPPLPPPTPPLSPSTLPLKRRHHPSLPRNSWLVHLLVGLCMSVSWSGLGCVRLLVGLQPTQERTPSTSATQFHPHSSSFADKYVSSSFLQKYPFSFLVPLLKRRSISAHCDIGCSYFLTMQCISGKLGRYCQIKI